MDGTTFLKEGMCEGYGIIYYATDYIITLRIIYYMYGTMDGLEFRVLPLVAQSEVF